MRGPVFGQEQVGAAGEAEARLALSVSAEAGPELEVGIEVVQASLIRMPALLCSQSQTSD